MQRESYKTTEAFLSDPSFREWVLEGTGDWGPWLEQHPQMKVHAEEARLFLLASGVAGEKVTPEEISEALDGTWDKIRQTDKKHPVSFSSWWRYAAAAVVLLAGVTLWLNRPEKKQKALVYYSRPEDAGKLMEVLNTSAKPRLFTLPDQSSVVLQPGSKLSYPKAFAPAERVVYFSGEGFFEISRNPAQPFLVVTKEVITKVLGTSFRIKAYNDKPEVEVSVKTGSVKVISNRRTGDEARKDITLAPNESVRFDLLNLSFGKIQAQAPRIVPPGKEEVDIDHYDFSFTDREVSEVFAVLEKAYAIEISYPEILKDCHISSPLDDEPLPEKLKIICASIGNGTRFTMEDRHVRIYSDGCN